MIKGTHLHEEIEQVEKVIKDLEDQEKLYEATSLKAQVLTLKLLLNIRQNQVAVMPQEKMIKPKNKNNEETK